MTRSITLHRRRPNLVDLTLQVRPGITSYKFQSASNFDASFTTFANIPASGYASSTAITGFGSEQAYRGLTRFIFNPADYSITDTSPFFVRIIPAINGVDEPTEAIHMVLPYSSSPDRPVILTGSAPSAGSLSGSLEIQLPGQCRGLEIQNNDAGNDMYVAFEPGGPEHRVPAIATTFTVFTTIVPVFTQLFVRGSGGAVPFNAIMALRNNPIG